MRTARGAKPAVNILEAKSQLSKLIKSAQAGDEVIIANRGEPVARLVPVGPARRLQKQRVETHAEITPPGRPGGISNWMEDNPLPVYAQRSMAEIDVDIEAERNSWD